MFAGVVVDYTLPDAPRGEAIEAVLKYNIPVIVITGRLDNNTREQILNKPVVDYIPKQNAQVYEYLTRLIVRLERNSKIGILVVDDSLLSRNAAVNLLKRHNFITYEAKDGIERLYSTYGKYRHYELFAVGKKYYTRNNRASITRSAAKVSTRA